MPALQNDRHRLPQTEEDDLEPGGTVTQRVADGLGVHPGLFPVRLSPLHRIGVGNAVRLVVRQPHRAVPLIKEVDASFHWNGRGPRPWDEEWNFAAENRGLSQFGVGVGARKVLQHVTGLSENLVTIPSELIGEPAVYVLV